jgi:hypothetical protein
MDKLEDDVKGDEKKEKKEEKIFLKEESDAEDIGEKAKDEKNPLAGGVDKLEGDMKEIDTDVDVDMDKIDVDMDKIDTKIDLDGE